MSSHEETQPEPLVMRIEHSDHPVAAAVEVDAALAARRYTHYTIRGPLFGVATQSPGDGGRWRVFAGLTEGSGQQARDILHSALWFRAKDDTDDPVVRRRLLDAVSVLEKERVDELTVDGLDYRVVRADEFLYLDENGPEPARPTDPVPQKTTWDGRDRDPEPDVGFVIDHAAASGVMAGAERLALMGLCYRSERYPADVRADSERALETHPGVVVLPPAFRVVERTPGGWGMTTTPFATAHGARRWLYYALKETFPLVSPLSEAEKAEYARVAEEFRADGTADELDVGTRHFSIARIGRIVRIGPDGPEGPRPSDVDPHEPSQMHPAMDDDGTIHFDE
ncbi:DUF5954 family protein [Streptomyces otsuchiensis]|uniref:DUF5954 family protein n=1 Tax=Streptomyces otsuchiensis TaxID=2681388 RepID=UPI0010306FA1|nr:DUF5954 family protein [Streptomyces otsuchiensis]